MRVFIGSTVGGFVLLIWVFLAGSFPYWEEVAFRAPRDDLAVHQALSQNLPEPGVYWCLRNLPADPELAHVYNDGPTYIIHYQGGGHMAGLWESLLSLLVVLLAPLVPSVMLTLTNERIKASYTWRAGFIAGFGVFLAGYAEPFNLFFGGQPLGYTAFLGISSIIGWVLVGAVVGAIVRPLSGGTSGRTR